MALETGLRREEYVSLRFSDVVMDNLGTPLFIKVENYKANRIRGGADISQGMKSIPITHGLVELLHNWNLISTREQIVLFLDQMKKHRERH